MVSAIATVSGPTLPRNIVREINILEKEPSTGVMSSDKPAVPKAENHFKK